ncbi:MAG TPA: hypothetical protein VK536_00435 [Candidatus Limnocylindrales bacterium]|nr:hypothetical protein [Candidatus Limnocylindrales bacterium]
MSLDNEFFMPKKNVLRDDGETGKKAGQEKRFVHCDSCNELIGAVSVTLYEIDEKHYCSDCYSRKITALAVERDHFDIKQEKEARGNKA